MRPGLAGQLAGPEWVGSESNRQLGLNAPSSTAGRPAVASTPTAYRSDWQPQLEVQKRPSKTAIESDLWWTPALRPSGRPDFRGDAIAPAPPRKARHRRTAGAGTEESQRTTLASPAG